MPADWSIDLMHRFNPQCASPTIPMRSHPKPSPSTCTDLSQSVNGAVAPELQNLSAADLDILDAVIRRAGPSATTFFTIFKAYSDVLKDRGLDPQEVVYYGKLLKLGTLKGKDWGEKWAVVKAHSAGNDHETYAHTLGSFETETELQHGHLDSEGEYSSVSRQKPRAQKSSHYSTRRHAIDPPPTKSKVTKSSEPPRRSVVTEKRYQLDPKEFPILASISKRTDVKSAPIFHSDSEHESITPIPPPYKPTPTARSLQSLSRQIASTSASTSDKHTSKTVSLPITKKPAPIDLDDAFKNIKLEQDEKFADKFREDMLLARCWGMWREGFIWITTTHRQIGEARDKLQLRLYLQRWRKRTSDRKQKDDSLIKHLHSLTLRRFFLVWQTRLQSKRQVTWRNDMRQKMKLVKSKADDRILKTAWKQWRRLLLGSVAESHYRATLLIRYHNQWKSRLLQLDNLDTIAEELAASIHARSQESFWSRWKILTSLRHDERTMVERVNTRIMTNTFDRWRQQRALFTKADAFRNLSSMKHALQAWKRSVHSLEHLDNKAAKHVARQDDLLLRAIVRIWRARARGKRLEQFQTTVTLRRAWQTWRARIASNNARLDIAQNFRNRVDIRIAADTMVRWQHVLTSHKNAHEYAVNYNDGRLCARVLLLWRLRLRDRNQSAKVARWASRYFETRRAFRTWMAALEDKRRDQRLRQWEAARAGKIFNKWRLQVQKLLYHKQCERIIVDAIEKRVIANTLTQWTNRVIEIKSRELDVVHKSNTSLLRNAFNKWKTCSRQHAEELSLLESFLLVKQEDVLRKSFNHWLNVKRGAERRRLTHQHREEQLRQLAITSAWEKWRERFKDEQLRPLEYELLLSSHKNLLRRAFVVWRSKTETLPAIKFYTRNVKAKFFQNWRRAMPNALKAKRARETDRFNTLVRAFTRWTQTYKMKTTLKAVARAKSLQLPAATSRQPIVRSRPLFSPNGTNFPRRTALLMQDDESDGSEPVKPTATPRSTLVHPRSNRSNTRSEYSVRQESPERPRSFVPRVPMKPRSERSVARSEYAPSMRAASPVHSIASMPNRHTKSPRPMSAGIPPRQSEGTLWSAIKDLNPARRPPRNL